MLRVSPSSCRSVPRCDAPRAQITTGLLQPVVIRGSGGGCLVAGGAAARVRSARRRCLARDLVAGPGECEPLGAKGVHALAGRVAGLLVAREGVERMAVVDDLRFSVGPRAGGEER